MKTIEEIRDNLVDLIWELFNYKEGNKDVDSIIKQLNTAEFELSTLIEQDLNYLALEEER
jgi:hypothetical protein